MSSCVVELDAILQSMLSLKAPGVTSGKIASITALCNANIQSETVLIQRIYTHFKKAPATHKLGVLYVVDSVTRAWVEQARKNNQTPGPSAADGTFAAGVNRVTELLPSFMNDTITNAPEEQKARVLKLVDIWERGGTFPTTMLSGFKQKLTNDPRSTTPTGTPPKDFISLNDPNGTANAAAPDTSRILKALADMAKSNTTATGTPSQTNPSNVELVVQLSLLASEVMGGMIRHVIAMGTTIRMACAPLLAVIEIIVLGPAPLEFMVDVVMVVLLVVVTALYMEIMVVMAGAVEVLAVEEVETSIVSEAQTIAIVEVIVLADKSSKRCHLQVQGISSLTLRCPPITSKVTLSMVSINAYETNTDSRIVLSRTLFVGGVTSSEDVLRGIFAQFGLVQTCIVNVDKRHAFVKMLTRKEAMVAKEGMERYKSADMQLRTRWGVGFGPRDCSDYQTGVSIIPIDRLTDADRKWMLTAEYGGTGGQELTGGMIVEEPDIEIGAGVSSKAISRRMATDKGGHQGPRSSRDGPGSSGPPPPPQQRYRQPERDNRDAQTLGVPPAVPGFGFQFPGMPAGFTFPPGFVMPGTTPTQPPPPGAS
ncbi:protein NRD1, partial [Lecanoromycetidae sp. Uapishka_2]